MTPLETAQLGDLIAFGAYPQTAAGTDRTPIQWRVLENTGSELFVLSEQILDCKRYHDTLTPIIWRDCTLRAWLNSTFYDAAFSADEKALIQTTRCTDNGWDSPDTNDRVFLLSMAEIEALTDPGDGTATRIRRRTTATDFAKVRKPYGCFLYVYDKSVDKDYVVEHGEKRGCSWWWTRTRVQTEHPERAVFISARSNIKRYGEVSQPRVGVRPALKLTLCA